jgi:hypothetical protein
MSTFVTVNTYTYSVTYVTNKLLMSLQSIIRWSGLSPEKIAEDWVVLERGIKTWLATQDLIQLVLEVFNPRTGALIGRWDLEIRYGFAGDGEFWVNTDDIQYHIKKAGMWPSLCDYRVVATTKPTRPDVLGWSRTTLRSTDGFVRQNIGTTVDGSGLSVGTGYWRRV